MSLQALLFDLDGTLIDTNLIHARAFARAFEGHGYRVAVDRIAIEIGKGGDLLVGAILGDSANQKEGDAIRDAWEKNYLEAVQSEPLVVFDGALELIEKGRARGLQIALATSGESSVMDAVEASCGVKWRELFPTIVTNDDAQTSKPAPDIVSAAAQKLGVPPLACAFIGDTIYDARACREAGVACFCVGDGQHDAADLREAGARAVYGSLADLNADFDHAMRIASPGEVEWSDAKIEELMRAALEAARKGQSQGEVPIGAVIADGSGTIVARGWNGNRATDSRVAHAEMMAFANAAGELDPDDRGAILVTTLEPCVMCAGACMEAGIESVIYAMKAPFNGGVSRVSGVRDAGSQMPRFLGGVLASESRALLQSWLDNSGENGGAQFVRELLQATED